MRGYSLPMMTANAMPTIFMFASMIINTPRMISTVKGCMPKFSFNFVWCIKHNAYCTYICDYMRLVLNMVRCRSHLVLNHGTM